MDEENEFNMSQDPEQDAADIAQETPADDVFIAPSIHRQQILSGDSYTHASPVPEAIAREPNVGCVLGVDEAGRGPVLGTAYSRASNVRTN